MNKRELFESGKFLMTAFCSLNGIDVPKVVEPASRWPFDACAYYREDVINIDVGRCAAIGVAGMAWSYPGYSVDRTPHGVIAHELGHHVDRLRSVRRGPYYGDYSVNMRKAVGEPQLTSYCPNDAEWFAEMFRLFVTNPDLLRCLRPGTYAAISETFTPALSGSWRAVLTGAPERTIAAVERKLKGKS